MPGGDSSPDWCIRHVLEMRFTYGDDPRAKLHNVSVRPAKIHALHITCLSTCGVIFPADSNKWGVCRATRKRYMAVSFWKQEPCTWQHAARTGSICGMSPLGVSWTVRDPPWISGTSPQVWLDPPSPSSAACLTTQEPLHAVFELACESLSQHPWRILMLSTCVKMTGR